MRAPDFWYPPEGSPPGLIERLLAPAAYFYDHAGRWRRRLTQPLKTGVPVLCVGNLTVGGTGKTPAALALARLVRARGLKAMFLTRGYGGRERGPLRVDPAFHGAPDVGDEPLLLAAVAPTIVARDRASGAAAALAWGADVIVMDDGLQNPSLEQTLRLVVIDSERGFGNGRVIPAGPLREPISQGLARCDAVVLFGDRGQPPELALHPKPLPVFTARLKPKPEQIEALRDGPLFAFAGIGRPDKFFGMLSAEGLSLAGHRAFADHHLYSLSETNALKQEAHRTRARLVTTAKDIARLPKAWRDGIAVVEVVAEFAALQAFEHFLDQNLRQDRIQPHRSDGP